MRLAGRPCSGGPWPALSALLVMRWISTSINCLLPVAQVGGDFVRARLLALSGTPGPVAGASVVVGCTAGLLTQLAFALLGVVLLLRHLGHASELPHWPRAWPCSACSCRLRRGPAPWPVLAARPAAAPARQQSDLAEPDRQRRRARCRGHRLLPRPGRAGPVRRLAVARLAHGRHRGLGWRSWSSAGRVELTEAIILESLGQVARSAGFVIPGGLGVQESGILAAGIWLGLPPEIVLSAALLKRAREVVVGLPALVVWFCLDGPGRRLERADRDASPAPAHERRFDCQRSLMDAWTIGFVAGGHNSVPTGGHGFWLLSEKNPRESIERDFADRRAVATAPQLAARDFAAL